MPETVVTIEPLHNGPLIVRGKFEIILPDGQKTPKEGAVALCRCGHSGNKPLCDGTHRGASFKAE